MKLVYPVLAALALLFTAQAHADDADTIRTNLTRNHPGAKIKSIQPSPVPGIYEVYANGQLLYVTKNAEFVFVGANLFNDESKQNLTAQRMQQLTTIQFDKLPLNNAIMVKKGDGSHKFAVFTDPDCPYCKSLEQTLENRGLTDYTAYIFLLPLEQIHPDARAKAEAIWCSKDRAAAWHEWMVAQKLPEKATCETPIDANRQLAEDLSVNGTPTIYFSDGTLATPEDLLQSLSVK
jgi:thiol:disulfide interchange protein DsbC